jgi:hypothetical protein
LLTHQIKAAPAFLPLEKSALSEAEGRGATDFNARHVKPSSEPSYSLSVPRKMQISCVASPMKVIGHERGVALGLKFACGIGTQRASSVVPSSPKEGKLGQPFRDGKYERQAGLAPRRKIAMKTSKVFHDFNKITTQCELRRTLEFTIGRATYRVEVFYCYSNPKSPWVVQAYSESRTGWKCIPDFPSVSEKNEEAAVRSALSFLQH